jgi:hypothetical protein
METEKERMKAASDFPFPSPLPRTCRDVLPILGFEGSREYPPRTLVDRKI